jgi:6-phosphogluconolactonase (cycloisomerase 2 family)
LLGCLVICATALLAPTAQTDDGHSNGRGAVYVQTNTAPANYVMVFDRSSNGTLTPAGRVATGGVGKPAGNPPLGIPFLDSAGSVTLSDNGQFLFVVNAGDNTVSSFRVGPHGGLQLADVESSNGSRPVSSTSHGHVVYVLNSELTSANISGYRVGAHGQLTPIAGSVQPTSQPDGGMPAQIQFDSSGRVLTVTERNAGGDGKIDTFLVDRQGVAGPPVAHPTSGAGPFGIAFTHRNHMIVSNEHFPDVLASDVSSYDVTREGDVTPIDTEPANAGGACWNVITDNDKYVLVTSPFTLNINSFRIERDGNLTPVNGNSVVATAQGLTLDEALSNESRYLYVLVSDPAAFAFSQVNAYRVNHDGTITLIQTTAPFEGSSSGAAAW